MSLHFETRMSTKNCGYFSIKLPTQVKGSWWRHGSKAKWRSVIGCTHTYSTFSL